jgi:predicted amidohydrolase YtcJ
VPDHGSVPRGRLREAHAHVFQLGRSLGMVDLGKCTSREEMLEALGERARSEPGRAVLAHGARPDGFDEPGWPGLDELDRACGGAAVWAWCFDHHALLASTAALHAAGIDASTPDPHAGAFERTPDGVLTGLCVESAALHVWTAAPEPAAGERRSMVRAALRTLAGLGFSEVHDLKAQAWLPGVLRELDRAGELACDVVCWPLVEDLGEIAARRHEWQSARVRLGGGKVFVDGTLNSRTAWVLHPYADGNPTHPRGMAMMAVEDVSRALSACAEVGVPLAAHAIGDGAVRCVLDAVEQASGSADPIARNGSAHRVEHAELVDEADIERFVGLRVVASVQPCHLLPDIEALERAVPDRLDRVLPLRDLIDAGCDPGRLDGAGVVFGSDVPIVRANPGDSIQAAVHRTRAGLSRRIAPEQATTEAEAWAAFGAGPAGARS